MVSVQCRSNLDLMGERWPTQLPSRPMVGDLIQSATQWGKHRRQLELRVVAVSFKCRPADVTVDRYKDEWYAEIELHLEHFESIEEFHRRYRLMRGGV